MLAVAGLTFAYTSCTDYSKDIDENKNQIDAVSSELATAKQQIESLKTDVSNLQTAKAEAEKAISALQTSLKDLQTKHDADVKALEAEISKVKADYAKADEAVKADLQKKIDALTDALKTAEDNHAKELKTVNGLIEELQGSVKTINGQIETINKTLETLATKQELADVKTWAETTLATKDAVTEVITSVSVLSQTFEAAKKVLEQKDSTLTEDIKALNAKLTALEGQHASDVADLTTKIGEAKAAAAAAQATANEAKTAAAAAQSKADQAEEHAQKALGDIEALKNALGVYAENGKLAATIKALVNADSLAAVDVAKKYDELKALRLADSTWTATELAKKFNSSEFESEFGKYLKQAVEKDGIVNDSIAANIDRLRKEHESSLKALTAEVNTKFSALFSIAKQLKSLVFVPELYVDGIEATEYTFAVYTDQIASLLSNDNKVGEYIEYGKDNNQLTVKVLNCDWIYNDFVRYPDGHVHAGEVVNYFTNPASVVTYKMNPSTADVTGATLSFISDDKEFVKTRTSINGTSIVKLVSAKDGELKVSLDAQSLSELTEGKEPVYQNYIWSNYSDKISIFALQATVKNENGQDTTITSDFARLYRSALTFDKLAFAKFGVSENACGSGMPTQDHIYTTLSDALTHAPSVRVKFDEPIDLDDVVTTHYSINRPGVAASSEHRDYDADLKSEVVDDYGVTYEYEPVDYLVDGMDDWTSQSQHMFLKDGSIFTPCGVTTDKGERDINAVGEAASASVGRCPIVRVVMKVNGKVVCVGFIKFEIVEEIAYKVADPFEWTFRFFCAGDDHTTTWSEIENKVIKVSGLSKEMFCKTYDLENDGQGNAIQYIKDENGNFRQLPIRNALNKVVVPYFGFVTELTNEDPGTTTNLFKWTLNAEDMSFIYENYTDHKVTIYVRYTVDGKPATTEYKGIYVPLTAEVHKPVGTVGKKLSNFWFNEGASAKINVAVPNVKVTKDDPTKPWETFIDQVWEGDQPQFGFGAPYIQEDASKSQHYAHKYYFAPEQMSRFTIGDYTYQLVAGTDNNPAEEFFVYPRYSKNRLNSDSKDPIAVSNTTIPANELSYSIDATRGIYENTVLWCVYAPTNYASDNDWTKWTGLSRDKIATIFVDQNHSTDPHARCSVRYEDNEVAKLLLNQWKSNPAQYTESKLFANIGVAAICDANIAMPLNGAIHPYYFLRPINPEGVNTNYFVDGDKVQGAKSNINVFDCLSFKDWRGVSFYTAKPAVYNFSLFKWYNVSAFKLHLDEVTTDLSGGDLATTKLSDKTKSIILEHWAGDVANPTIVSTVSDLKERSLTKSNFVDGKASLNKVVADFGYIHYNNNGTTVDTAFKLRVPVSFTYTWGTIKTYFDITVKPVSEL